MAHFEHSFELDDDEALERLRALTDYWEAKHGVPTVWDGSTARLAGKKLGVRFDATVTVEGGRLRASVKAGFLAERLGARAYVERKLQDYLDPKHTLAELRSWIPG